MPLRSDLRAKTDRFTMREPIGFSLRRRASSGPGGCGGLGAALVDEAVRRAGSKRCTQRHRKRRQIPATSVFTRALKVRSSKSVSEMAQVANDVNINNARVLLPVPRARLEIFKGAGYVGS